ncbi:LAMI_0H01816g1_1 [Lachancea mirantina]|uniref:Mitochondrial intermembrane space import and assembly protein 40 n=1 Tax=Lachancea mirantina TaxID=1230905 RepID=A0A1G4KDT3_9SACH|nr:LAMI_0H01816g1_1 [Lachancea mirantina]
MFRTLIRAQQHFATSRTILRSSQRFASRSSNVFRPPMAKKFVGIVAAVGAVGGFCVLNHGSVNLETKKTKTGQIEGVPASEKSERSEKSEKTPGNNEETGEKPEGENEDEPQSAYNPETGEINWDCPCLGGMANGPCGEEFKLAFSCFVYSEADPKGIDCVEKFKGMQDCFRRYPDYYAEQIKDEEEAAQATAEMESKHSQEEMQPEAQKTPPELSTTVSQEHAVLEPVAEEHECHSTSDK